MALPWKKSYSFFRTSWLQHGFYKHWSVSSYYQKEWQSYRDVVYAKGLPTSAISQKESSKIKNEGIGLTGDNEVFINHSLFPYYRILWSKWKVFLNMSKINRLKVSNRTVKVKISEIRAPISITHADDFTKYFPDINLSLSEQTADLI